MRKVKFIRSLNVELLSLHSTNVKYYSKNFTPVMEGEIPYLLDTPVKINTVVVPITQLTNIDKKGERVDTFIAYSEEVEELLVMPFKAIREEIDIVNSCLDIIKYKVINATFIKRLKYLFTGKLI